MICGEFANVMNDWGSVMGVIFFSELIVVCLDEDFLIIVDFFVLAWRYGLWRG